MAINVLIYIPSNSGGYTDAISGEYYKPGEIAGFDSAVTDELAEANRIISAGAGLDVSELVTALIQVAWANITGKPSSFTPSAHTHTAADIISGQFANARIGEGSVTQHQAALALTIAQIAGLQAALDARVLSSEKGAANGVATLDANTLIPLALIPGLSADQTTGGTFDAARIPDLDWSKIIEATRPDTLAGYGITDALTATQVGQEIQTAIDTLVGGAPGALDTLNELAAALGDDPNAIATLTNAVASKLDASLWQAATAAVDGFMSKEDKAKLDGIEAGATGDMTGAEIKAAYEAEADTNAFVDADKAKLDGIEAGATANATNAQLRDRSTHTGTQPQSSIDDLESDLADRLLRSELPYASLVHYSSTDDATDMAAGATVKWNSALMTDSGISVGGVNNTNITVSEAGKYVVSVRLVYADTSAEGVDVNNTLGVSILVNGVSVGRQGVGSPVVNADGANEGQAIISEPLDLEPGDVVTVTTQRLSGGDELYLIAGQSSLIVERKGGKSAALAAQRFRELSDTPNDYTDEGAILRVKTGGGIEYTLTIPQSAVADLVTTLSNKADLVGGKIPTAQIPAVSLTEVHAVADTAARDALTVQEGDVAVVASESKSYIYDGSDWLEINAAAPVQSVNGQIGVVVLTKGDIGLGNVDNTSDADKPVSTAQAAAIAEAVENAGGGLKVAAIQTAGFTPDAGTLYPVDTSGGAVALSALLAAPEYGDECALVTHNASWTPAAPLTLPGSVAAPVNGEPYDRIITAPSYVAIRYAGANYGFEVTVIALDQTEYREPHVRAPSITSPADTATDIVESPTLTASAFAPVNAPGETHAASDWQVATDSGFASIVVQSADDAVNLESWKVPAGNLAVSTTYYARVRYAGATYGDSLWSDPISFTTATEFLDGHAQAIIDQMSTPPASARQLLIDDFVTGLKADGLWPKLLALWVPAAHDAQAAGLNWKDPAGVSLSPINAPVFTADEGFTGDGSAAYLDTGVKPSDYPAYETGAASVGVLVGPSAVGANGYLCGVNDRQTGAETSLGIQLVSGKYRARVNSQSSTGSSVATAAVNDLVIVTKTDTSASTPVYINGSLDNTGSAASVRPPEQNIYLLCQRFDTNPNGFASAQISLAFIGTGLTATDAANLNTRVSAYIAGL